MTVYTLIKQYQGTDMDSWSHWVENHIVAYYATKESVEKAIALLIEDLEYPSYTDMVWTKLGDSRNTTLISTNLNGRDPEVYNLYVIGEIDVLP